MFVHMPRRRRLVGWLVGVVLGTGLLLPLTARAQLAAAAAAPLDGELQAGQVEALQLTWIIGRLGEAQDILRIAKGAATLQHAAQSTESATTETLSAVGAPQPLTAGQRGQLVSVLRAAALPTLRSADPEASAAADRVLELAVAAGNKTQPIGRWQLGRSDWPTPPGGYGMADYLDELAQKLRRLAQVRAPVAIPSTVAELDELRLQLRLTPRTRPGGLITIEHGVIHVTPAEGSLPRSPRPAPWERPLQNSEAEQLVKALQAAQLDRLDQVVVKRAAPAVGDDDGRLATLHLMRAEPVVAKQLGAKSKSAARPVAPPEPRPSATLPPPVLRDEPRGVERYLADLMRSTAQPLLGQLVAILLAPPPAGAPRAGKPTAGAR